MAGEAASEPEEPACQLPEMNEDFQFLQCDRCHAEVPHPRLLPCLHNLCSQCLEETKPINQCVICGTPNLHLAGSPENVFFANLQVKLSLYRKITGSEDLICDNCKKEAEFWCTTCQEFLCLFCFRSHQRYLKKESHEARPLKDLRAESCRDFLLAIKQLSTLVCTKEGHETNRLSLYCRRCSQPMCTICALLDTGHMNERCNISEEIQCRQNELKDMSVELKEKKNAYDETYSTFAELLRNMEQLRNETRELIQQKIEEMIQMLREKGAGFLAEVEAHHNHQVQDVNEKLQEMDGVVERITSSQRLVDQLRRYASGQEVLEIHAFLRKSMMELRMKQPSTTEGIEVRNFKETKSRLQNLLERVTKDKEAVPATTQTEPQEVCARAHREQAPAVLQPRLSPTPKAAGNCQMALAPSPPRTQSAHQSLPQAPGLTHVPPKPPHCPTLPPAPLATRKPPQNLFLPVKRSYAEKEMNTEGHPKKVKNEPLNDEDWNDSALNRPGTSYGSPGGSYVTGSQGDHREIPDDILLMADDYSDTSNPEDDSLMNISEEEEEDDDDDDDDDETGASVLPLDINPTYPAVDNRESTIIFFNLKPLRGNALHLVAVGEEDTKFHVMVSCRENTSECIGMDEFLQYLHSLQRPILVGYKLWTMALPALLDALHKINKEEQFEASISGFLDALPLIMEKFLKNPNSAVKKLEKVYQYEQLDNNHASNFAKNLKHFCTSFEINMFQRRPLIACSNFRRYFSLQPLLQKKLLSMPSAKTLALHNISLDTLHSIYQSDPEKGLMKLCRDLNSRRRIGEKKINRLSKIRIYFQALPSSSITSIDSLRNTLS